MEETNKPVDYLPSPEDVAVIAEVDEKFRTWREDRRPYEVQWFLNQAFRRGNQNVLWNESQQRLENRPQLPNRIKLNINLIGQKIRARISKFLKNRPKPMVIPASTDREDKMNARATQKVLDYIWRKQNLEMKYVEALNWAHTAGKGFWWIYWDDQSIGRFNQNGQVVDAPMGDPDVEVGTPFELLVSDLGKTYIGDQPEIMRIKIRTLDDVQARYGDTQDPETGEIVEGKGKYVKADSSANELFFYERQIANVNSQQVTGFSSYSSANKRGDKYTKYVVCKELFAKPCGKYPNGRYVLVAGGVVLKNLPKLPYQFSTFKNPYPVIEFADMQLAGQFWATTHVEQMIGLQQEYNASRTRLQEHLKLNTHPKVFIPVQFKIGTNAWSNEAGELIRYVAAPGMPAPSPWTPPPIAGDIWRGMDQIRKDMDDVTNIYPASQGSAAGSESGFMTNLLQEATDAVHAPDIRAHEKSFEDAYYKLRRLIKIGYDIPRLVSITGRNYNVDVFEFKGEQIDEFANIQIVSGSGLSSSPAVRSQQVMELYDKMLLGDPNDPNTRRQAISMLGLTTMEELSESLTRDEEQARLENYEAQKGSPMAMPQPWEDHTVHYQVHTDVLKSPEIKMWPPELRDMLIKHLILHVKYIDPVKAFMLAQEFGYQDLIEMLMPAVAAAEQQQQAQAAQAQSPEAQSGEQDQPPPGNPS